MDSYLKHQKYIVLFFQNKVASQIHPPQVGKSSPDVALRY